MFVNWRDFEKWCGESREWCEMTNLQAHGLVFGVVAALLLIVSAVGLTGCAMFDWDGNDRFDPLEYLSNADISIAWVDADGKEYNMALDKLGVQLVGQFIQAKTGYLFEIADDGARTITDPYGKQVKIQLKSTEEAD